jgi:hypothetical protein
MAEGVVNVSRHASHDAVISLDLIVIHLQILTLYFDCCLSRLLILHQSPVRITRLLMFAYFFGLSNFFLELS